jgi:phosphoribosylformylglycinamidine synthase
MAMASGIGAAIDPAPGNTVAAFFGEDQGRYVLTATAAHAAAIGERATTAGVAAVAIGRTGGPDLKLGAARAISVAALAAAHEGWFPGFMAGH